MTRAIEFLKSRSIPFEIVEYGHQEKGAVFASEAIGMPLEQTVKTLVVEVAKKGYREDIVKVTDAEPTEL